MTLLALRAFLGGALSAIWRFLSRLSPCQLACLGLFALACYMDLQRDTEHRARVKAEAQIVKLVDANKRAAAEAKKRETAANHITDQLRREKDEADRRIASDAHSLLMRGPGRAACFPAVPKGSGGSQGANGKPDVAGPALPPDDRAGVPWDWLVNRAQEHDTLRQEVLSWREWYQQQSAISH